MRKPSERGNALIQFTLVGIPAMFLLISTFEMSRAMWTYATLVNAIKEGTRFAMVKGTGCSTPNSCSVQVKQVAQRIKNMGVGLIPQSLNLTFTAAGGTAITCRLDNCLTNSTPWPPATYNGLGLPIRISGSYSFSNSISMFWPGARHGIVFGPLTLVASSRQMIQF